MPIDAYISAEPRDSPLVEQLVSIGCMAPVSTADPIARLDTITLAAGDTVVVFLVVIPATLRPTGGPVAIVTPAGAASAFELFLGAGIAALTGSRVEHLNARGRAGSAVHSDAAPRTSASAAVIGWREISSPRPAAALRVLASRPSIIVAAVEPDPAACTRLIAEHPDADVILVIDAARARHGRLIAEQVSTLVESAIGVQLALSGRGESTAAEPDETPAAELIDPSLVRASEVIHVRLTDHALEVVNRTRQRVKMRVSLGSASDASAGCAALEVLLEPHAAHSASTDDVPGLAGLAAPTAVMRNWSHTQAEVYEGGERRMLRIDATVLDDADDAVASASYEPSNGLDFALTGRDLGALLGHRRSSSALPEPAPAPVSRPDGDGLLSAFDAAVAVGVDMLARMRP